MEEKVVRTEGSLRYFFFFFNSTHYAFYRVSQSDVIKKKN